MKSCKNENAVHFSDRNINDFFWIIIGFLLAIIFGYVNLIYRSRDSSRRS